MCFYHANEGCHKVAADLLQNCGKHLAVLWEKGLYKAKHMHAQALRDVAVLKCRHPEHTRCLKIYPTCM